MVARALHQQGELDQAEAIYTGILQSEPRHFDALRLLATVAAQRGNCAAAVELFEQALAINPEHAGALNNLGVTLCDLMRHADALAYYDRALAIEPAYADAHYNRGNALVELERYGDALASYDRTLALQPDWADAHYNRGSALRGLKRHDDARASYDRCLAIAPDHADSLFSRGNTLRDLRRHDDAVASYSRALSIRPDDAAIHMARAHLWLLVGDYARAWPEHEWRWKYGGARLPQLPQPRWRGEPLDGHTILLHWEQGLGDTLQFVRYARVLQRRGARVIVCCQEPLVPLLQHCEGIDVVVAHGAPLPDCDYWTPLLSVPGPLGTDQDSIPGECGYIDADPALVARWKLRLADYPGFRIAIVSRGSPSYLADRQRSIPLQLFGLLAQVPGVRLIDLRKGTSLEPLANAAGSFEIIQFAELDTTHGAFMDTAAILRNVNLTVSCDTSVVHLAGALGVPVWLAQIHSPDWRWQLDREDSPWYPSLRLFRQRAPGEWDDVFQRMARALRERLDPRLDRPLAGRAAGAPGTAGQPMIEGNP